MIIQTCGFGLEIPAIYEADFAEEAPVRNMLWKPQRDDVVIDVGCSLGTYTLPALAAGAFALAVDVLYVDPLVAMAQDNDLAGRLIALTDTIVAGPDGYPKWLTDGIEQNPESYPEVLLENKAWTTIDQLVERHNLPHVNWIKVDTEGGELPIMLGAARTLTEWKPTLVIEEHSHMPWVRDAGSGDALLKFLTDLGYYVHKYPYRNREIWLAK